MFGNISRKDSMEKSPLSKFESKVAVYLLKTNFAINILVRIFRTTSFKSSCRWLFLE